MAISQKTIDTKIRFINGVIEKVKRGTATSYEIVKACDMIAWLWKWKVIDREETGKLADAISDAMEGK
jgi:hypothetical protein